MTKYQKARNRRREARTLAGRFRGGKLMPVQAVAFRESESGSVSQKVTFELDPIAGRMITDTYCEVISVFVPAQAIDAHKNPDDDYPGNDEVFRTKLLSGNPVFDLEPETEISERLGINPRSINGQKQVNEVSRLAHNVAVNFLRRRKYHAAAQLDATNTAITPAIISQSVLDRLNGVLDPEDRVNGAVNLDIQGRLDLHGLGTAETSLSGTTVPGGQLVRVPGGTRETYDRTVTDVNDSKNLHVEMSLQNGMWAPNLFVDLADGGGVGGISLTDLYQARKMDQLTREMRQIVDAMPEYGEELVARFAHGLSVDFGKQPLVLYEKRARLQMGLIRAMDGASLDQTQSNHVGQIEFTVPVPVSEFGGVVITFAALKPDETLAAQPHPILSDTWGLRNYVADEMAVDPVPVTVRDLYSDCSQADEETISLYVGNNHLMANYINYGFNRALDPTTVEAKTALWQLEVPTSVTPESILYPDELDHYPFSDQLAEVCTYTAESLAVVNTPVIFGPTPVEELAAIETGNVFSDQE